MVSSRPHNFFDTASYAKPLRFQINLATFLNLIYKHFEKICPLGNSTGTFWGQNSKMAKLAKTAVIAGPRAAIFEISKFLSKKLRLLPKNHPRVAIGVACTSTQAASDKHKRASVARMDPETATDPGSAPTRVCGLPGR